MKRLLALLLFSTPLWILSAQNIVRLDLAFGKKADEFVSKIVAMQDSARLINVDHMMTLDIKSFDLEKYIAAFDKLDLRDSIEKAKIHYYGGWLDGCPIIYMSDGEDLDYIDWESFAKYDLVNYFEVEDSPEGYFQLIVYKIIGQRFALYWHSNYGEVHIVCTAERLNKIYELMGKRLGKRKVDDPLVYERDYTPKFAINKDSCTISVYTFSPFGGLLLNTFSVKRSSPYYSFWPFDNLYRHDYTVKKSVRHTITILEQKWILKYHCGILF